MEDRLMDWKRLLACITGSVEKERLLRHEYLVTENLMLHKQIEGRVPRTDAEHQSLAEIAIQYPLGLARKLVARKFDGSEQRKRAAGRPRVD